LIENHIRMVFTVLLMVFLLGFLWYFSVHQNFVREHAGQRLREHAIVIANSLWRYEEPPVSYLELAARSNHYKTALVLDDSGQEYARVTGPEPDALDGFMARAGLLPVLELEEPVLYKGRVIGTIRVAWQNRAAFVYFYIIVCLLLFFIGIWFFCNLYIAKKTLKDRVKERTADLKESQDRLQAILDNAEAIIYLKDVQGRYITVNRRFENLFKVERTAIEGLRDHDVFSRDLAEEFRKNDEKILSGKKALQFEESAPGPQGSLRDYISVKFPLKKTDGSVYAVCGISTDITDMKLAEQEVRHLRNYLSNIIDSMPSVLIGMDREGKISLWNRRAEQVSGFNAGQAMGRSLEEVFPRLSPSMDQVKEAIKTRKEQQSKKQARLTDNTLGYEDVIVFPLVGNGVDGAVVRIDDVTDQVRLEEMMIQSEKMLSVGGLAAGMAHEINNPLAGMMQTANVMKLRLDNIDMAANLRVAEEIGVSPAHIRAFMEKRGIFQMLDAISDSGARVAEIVDNMLSFARKTDAIVSSHNPCDLMDRILELAATDYDLKRQYDFKTIKIVKEYEDNLPMLPCEGAKIQQVILNILSNGAQAMVAGNQENPCFTLGLSMEKEANMLRMEIRDNGPGMDRAVQKRIFDPFFTTKPPGVGTGLGLSVSYFIITENHGGTMGVSSSPGRGANFIIRLPLEAHGTNLERETEHDG